MSLSITHKFQSNVPDGPDPTLVKPSNWNDTHAITAAASVLLGNPASIASNVTEIAIGSGLSFSGTSLVATGAVANPTSKVGLTAVNGTATTAMRSDGAPALDQTISPTWTGNHLFKGGIPWFDVKAFGALGNNSNDDASAIQSAINAANSAGGGLVWFPTGTYRIGTTLTVSSSVVMKGASRNATLITVGSTDTVAVSVTGGTVQIEDLQIQGKGYDTVSFGATSAAMTVSGNNSIFRNLSISGGTFALDITGSNNYFDHVGTTNTYGAATCRNGGGNYFLRCDFDNQGSGITSASTMPYAAWAGTTAIGLHETRLITNGGNVFACVATVAGTTGGAAPTMKNYGQTFTDGTVTWSLQAPQTYYGLQVTGSGVSENHFTLCDLTGVGYAASISFTAPASGPVVVDVLNSDVSYGVSVAATANAQAWLNISGCELGGGNGIGSGQALNVTTGYSGVITCVNNYINSPPGAIVIGAGVSNFDISGNVMAGSSITVNAGASDKYRIAGNVNATVSDGGTGTNKYIQNNGAVTALSLTGISNNLGFGTETNPQGKFVFSANAATGISPTGLAPTAGNIFYIFGPDSTNTTQLFFGFAGFAGMTFARSEGTGASPTATGAGNTIGQLGFAGYNAAGSTWTVSKARIAVIAEDTFSNTTQGASIEFDTTPSGSTARAQALRLKSGAMLGSSTTDPGSGAMIFTPTTVSALPAVSTSFKGAIATVSDGSPALAWGAAVTSSVGSSTPYMVYCNGTAWTVAGK